MDDKRAYKARGCLFSAISFHQELPDIERTGQTMNLLPQTLDFQGILIGHPPRLIDGTNHLGQFGQYALQVLAPVIRADLFQ